jgi:hypothetical protein
MNKTNIFITAFIILNVGLVHGKPAQTIKNEPITFEHVVDNNKKQQTYSDFLVVLKSLGVAQSDEISQIEDFLQAQNVHLKDKMVQPSMGEKIRFGSISLKKIDDSSLALTSGEILIYKKNRSFVDNFKNIYGQIKKVKSQQSFFSFFVPEAHALDLTKMEEIASSTLYTAGFEALRIAAAGISCTAGLVTLPGSVVYDVVNYLSYAIRWVKDNGRIVCSDDKFYRYLPQPPDLVTKKMLELMFSPNSSLADSNSKTAVAFDPALKCSSGTFGNVLVLFSSPIALFEVVGSHSGSGKEDRDVKYSDAISADVGELKLAEVSDKAIKHYLGGDTQNHKCDGESATKLEKAMVSEASKAYEALRSERDRGFVRPAATESKSTP